jgi:hypothetical protein
MGFWNHDWSIRESPRSHYRSVWEGRVQPRCAVCGKQFSNESEMEPHGKKGKAFRHHKCAPKESSSSTLTGLAKLISKRWGSIGWRKRHGVNDKKH